jgi:predicted transcriptional regulator
MRQLDILRFSDFDNPQLVWEVYGELLNFYNDQDFSAKQVAYATNLEVTLINKILHRLIHHKAVVCTGKDHWGVKTYRLNETFKN